LTVPDYADLMLSSIVKRIDNSVYQAIERALNGEDPEPVFVSTLENEGVGLAPFHDYETRSPMSSRPTWRRWRPPSSPATEPLGLLRRIARSP